MTRVVISTPSPVLAMPRRGGGLFRPGEGGPGELDNPGLPTRVAPHVSKTPNRMIELAQPLCKKLENPATNVLSWRVFESCC